MLGRAGPARLGAGVVPPPDAAPASRRFAHPAGRGDGAPLCRWDDRGGNRRGDRVSARNDSKSSAPGEGRAPGTCRGRPRDGGASGGFAVTSVLHPCCDDWMALDRRGALSTSERDAMARHLESCPDCRITRQLMVDFEHSGAPEPGDELIFGRAAKAVLARRPDRRTRAPRFAVAAALVLLVGGAASGAVLVGARLMAPSIGRDDLRRRPGSKPVVAPRWTVGSHSSTGPSTGAAGAAVGPPDALPTEVELPRKVEEAGPSRPGALPRAKLVASRLV